MSLPQPFYQSLDSEHRYVLSCPSLAIFDELCAILVFLVAKHLASRHLLCGIHMCKLHKPAFLCAREAIKVGIYIFSYVYSTCFQVMGFSKTSLSIVPEATCPL